MTAPPTAPARCRWMWEWSPAMHDHHPVLLPACWASLRGERCTCEGGCVWTLGISCRGRPLGEDDDR